jgi:tetratricopeptide (TPR) repeat protein
MNHQHSFTKLSRRPLLRIAAVAGAVSLAAAALYGAVDLGKAGNLWGQSVTLEKSSDYKGAIAKVAEFGRSGADPYLVNLRTGWLSLQNKDYDQAIVNYQAAAGRAPSAVTPSLGLANAYRAKGDNDNAEHACRLVLSHDPGNYTALQMLGLIYFDKKDYANASSIYDTILKLYPEDTAALSGYGWAQIYLNRKANAVPEFQRLLILAPDYQYAEQGYATAITP